MDYTFYVDESGDQGIEKVRDGIEGRGASPFMTLGGVLVRNPEKDKLRSALADISNQIGGKPLHCVDLNHLETAYVARRVGELNVRFFGVVSDKTTMGNYKDKIAGKDQSQSYYNKCSHYLLERLGHFAKLRKLRSDQIAIVFEENRSHDYDTLRNYIRKIQKNPLNEWAKLLRYLDVSSISVQAKSEEPLLAMADVAAYGLFQSVNESRANFGIPEQRYLRELRGKFWSCPDTGKIGGFGLNYIRGPEGDMALKGSALSFAKKMNAARPKVNA